jgi:hypothetical protein
VASRQAVPPSRSANSQLVTLSDPILPILDHLAGLLVYHDALQLGQGNRKGAAFLADQDGHLVLALLSRVIPMTSASSPTRSGEMARSAVHLAANGGVQPSWREGYQPMACSSGV